MSRVAREGVFAVVGVAATSLGILLFSLPEVGEVGPLAWMITAIAARPAEQLLLVLGLTVVGYLMIGLRSPPERETASPARSRFDRIVERGPERVTTGERTVTAATLDAELESAIADGGPALDAVRSELRAVTISLVAAQRDISVERATSVVDSGEWCRDPVATAFLQAEPSWTLGETLRYVIVPTRERKRRIERAVAAIEGLEQQ